jgi:hypothetical protein
MPMVSGAELSRWRGVPAVDALTKLASYAKQDRAFVPVKDPRTTRWHATVQGREYELLLTGPKFFDTRIQRGGGGAVDLAMHLVGVDFRSAVELLRRHGL